MDRNKTNDINRTVCGWSRNQYCPTEADEQALTIRNYNHDTDMIKRMAMLMCTLDFLVRWTSAPAKTLAKLALLSC
jgi:hypothetical protein